MMLQLKKHRQDIFAKTPTFSTHALLFPEVRQSYPGFLVLAVTADQIHNVNLGTECYFFSHHLRSTHEPNVSPTARHSSLCDE